jgi:hypothetical protein
MSNYCKDDEICEDLSQGTFDILWRDLFEGSNEDQIITAVTEVSNVDFMNEQGIDIEMLFTEMNEDPADQCPEHNVTLINSHFYFLKIYFIPKLS